MFLGVFWVFGSVLRLLVGFICYWIANVQLLNCLNGWGDFCGGVEGEYSIIACATAFS